MIFLNNIEQRLSLLYASSLLQTKVSKEKLAKVIVNATSLNYFAVQLVINNLIDDGLLENDSEYVSLTPKGSEVIDIYKKDIPLFVKNKIEEYIEENKDRLLDEYKTVANLTSIGKNSYLVTLKLIENGRELLNLEIEVTSREMATNICRVWNENYTEIFHQILLLLSTQKKED